MTNVCFIRHGETEWNSKKLIQGRVDTPLNDIGIKQAEIAGEKLRELNIKWDAIFSSPLKRALDTAKIALEKANINSNINIVDDLIERDFGDYEGEPVSSANFYKMNNEVNLNTESLSDLVSRVKGAVDEISKSYPNSNVLIFSHSQVIKAILISIDSQFDFNYRINNASLNFIQIDNNNYTVTKINY